METTQADITDLKNLHKLLDWEILLQFTIYFDFEFDLDVTSLSYFLAITIDFWALIWIMNINMKALIYRKVHQILTFVFAILFFWRLNHFVVP